MGLPRYCVVSTSYNGRYWVIDRVTWGCYRFRLAALLKIMYLRLRYRRKFILVVTYLGPILLHLREILKL